MWKRALGVALLAALALLAARYFGRTGSTPLPERSGPAGLPTMQR